MTTVHLAWSVDDLAHLDASDVAVPLTATALVEARARGLETIDTSALLGPAQVLEELGLQTLNRLHTQLAKQDQGWLEAVANVAFGVQAFQLVAWLRLLRGLHQSLARHTAIRLPSFAFAAPQPDETFIYTLAREALHVAARVARRRGVPILDVHQLPLRSRLRRLSGAMAASTAGHLARATAPLDRIRASTLGRLACADVLLVTQQYNDAVHAVPLAKQLHERFGTSFMWLGPRPRPAANLTEEEAGLIGTDAFESFNFVDSAPIYEACQTASRVSDLLDAAAAWQVAGYLSELAGVEAKRTDWYHLLSGVQYRGLTMRAALWNAVLDTVQPKVIAGLSSLQDMALVRAWARRRAIPFVMLMHGVFPSLRRSHDSDADYLGVFGPYLAESVLPTGIDPPREIRVCGPMQFADKARGLGVGSSSLPSAGRQDVLFLGSFESLPFAPVSPTDQWEMLSAVHKACVAAKRRLRLRLHPRFPHEHWAPFVDDLNKLHPGTVEVSTDASITRDLGSCICAVASHFDGAVMDALLTGTAVLSYLPAGHEFTAQTLPLRDLTGVFSEPGALTELLKSDPGAPTWSSLRRTQAVFLERYFDPASKSTWAGAVQLIEHVLEEQTEQVVASP